ncbi:hypothetical protein [Dactylosporangium salmoneum]|uniref:Uncharacterized protein n=1 Tax=Dactylosporangium salmoneum TaxID=53361 RepID=A0ABP5UL67_9ACTN
MPVFETITGRDGKQYQLVETDISGTERYLARPVDKTKPDIDFSDFDNPVWRTWSDKTGAAARDEVPSSTASIPATLFKKVQVKHLDSIATEGLVSTPERVTFYGFSAGTTYATRDRALAAIWLSTNGKPGELMKPDHGVWIDLEIKVSPMFATLFLRDVNAVLNEDDRTPSDTVLSFGPIPPAAIWLRLPAATIKQIEPYYEGSVPTTARPLARVPGYELRALSVAMTKAVEERKEK